ncbi:hypothetical protein PMAYCL1PPCAC_16345, partial [Pristionchus mayeri]
VQMLTVDAAVSALLALLVLALACVQILGHLHSPDIEGLVYDVAVLPALIHPALTLYFVPSYRAIIWSCFGLRKSTISVAQQRDIYIANM